MKYNQLGKSNLNVSEICLGSMTWGTQNSEAEGHAQIDYALDLFGEPGVMVETASGGVHLYFQHRGEKNATRIQGRPIDIRGRGGLIIVPASMRDGIQRSISGEASQPATKPARLAPMTMEPTAVTDPN